MCRLRITVFACVLLISPLIAADTVTLSNGDRVTGTILRSDNESMVMSTEFLGEVKIKWDSIASVQSGDTVFLTDDEGQIMRGTLTASGDEYRIQTESAQAVTVEKAKVVAIRSVSEQEAYLAELDRQRNPGLLDLWAGQASVSYALAKGNSDTTTLATGFNADRKTQRDTFAVYFNSINSKTGTDRPQRETTANAVRGGVRYDLNFKPKLFGFAFTDLEYDEFQDLDLRNVIGGGLGWRVRETERLTFNLRFGGTFNQEFFSIDPTRRSGEVLIGEELGYRLGTETQLKQTFLIYPNLSETGEYRMQFDVNLGTKIAGWLQWNLTLSDRFLSNPASDRKKNDVLLSTGIGITFGSR